ncbi:MAG: hypothetical protein J0J10_00940, partial [Bosea sp.]|nr:hypothetical protein [Bosea sp. (in: a-proteobacteria)]
TFHKTDGTLIGDLDDLPFNQLTDLTTVWDAVAQNSESWVWDVTLDPVSGHPVATFATFSKPDPAHTDHFYRQGRWNGSAWVVKLIAAGGGSLYPLDSVPYEYSYSGGAVSNPADPNVVICSREVNSAGAVVTNDQGVHHLFKAVTADGGDNWTLTQLTFGSAKHFRPFIPEGSSRAFFCRDRLPGGYIGWEEYGTVIDSMPIAGA